MAGVALGFAGPGLQLVASKRALSSAPSSSSSPSGVGCSASLPSYTSARVRSQKALVLRSSFVARTTHSSFWDGGVEACLLALAVEDSIKQSKSGGALCAQANIFERVVRIVREDALQRLAGIFVGIALLVANVELGLTRPARARAPPSSTAETSSAILNKEGTELDLDDTYTENAVESTPSQLSREEEKDPAELVLLSYLKRHPEDMKALEGLMYVRLRKGSVAKALETVDKLLALRPNHTPWQLIRAQALEFLGDLEEARHAFESILEKDPLSARALQGLATVMSKAGEGSEMLEMLRRAVQSSMKTGKAKESKNLRMLLGQMYTLQGNLEEALAQYQELEKEDPKDFRPYLCQGLVYSLLNMKVDADRAFLKYRRRCPKTFPERGYLDDLMIGAKTEARKIQAGERLKPAKGKKVPKPLQQPNIDTALSEDPDGGGRMSSIAS